MIKTDYEINDLPQTEDYASNDSVDIATLIDDDFEEFQAETPWEIFTSEFNNWSARYFSADEFACI